MAFDYAPKIRALLAMAEDESLSDEARANYRAKAAELMKSYRIAEEEAIAADPGSVTPISLDIVLLTAGRGHGDLNSFYTQIMCEIADHTGVRVHFSWSSDWSRMATVVGYEGDVRYTEFLWTAAYLMFSTRIDPIWDSTRTPEENIFLLRNAGIERRVIADKAWGNGNEAAARSRVQRIYLREAARRGEDARAAGLGFDTRMYREAYAQSFIDTLGRRLRIARDAANSVGGGVVLHGRADRVREAFYDLFPQYRPTGAVSTYVDPRANCEGCKKAKSGYCGDHKYLKPRKWSQADEMAYQRRINSPSARAGRTSGRDAATGVNLTRGHTTAQRLDASGRAIEG